MQTVNHRNPAHRPGRVGAWSWVLLAAALGAQAAPRASDVPSGAEVRVTTSPIIDYEFDWGRDGVDCPSCNGGDGNSRLTFVDGSRQLWVAHVDPLTGAFLPADGKGERVDRMAAFATDFGNGPEWALSQQGSQIVYTKYVGSSTPDKTTAGVVMASQVGSGWVPSVLPSGAHMQSPLASGDASDLEARVHYQDLAKLKTYWQMLDVAQPLTVVPLSGYAAGSRRWVPGTHKIILSARGQRLTPSAGYHAVFLYDTDTGATEQITNEAADNFGAMMWAAPEYGGDWVFFSIRNGAQLVVYRYQLQANGRRRWVILNEVSLPAETPYLWSPEYFIHNGKSYIFFQMNTGQDPSDFSQPSRLAMVGILPENAALVNLTPADAPARVRMDPEYFITAQGPFIYYNRYQWFAGSQTFVPEGVWRVDTQLGPAIAGMRAAH
ncbi:hypothetical protein KGA65_13390 [Ideonella sp. B7]|nr:hypothetical protein [Ideonella benzenivorans]